MRLDRASALVLALFALFDASCHGQLHTRPVRSDGWFRYEMEHVALTSDLPLETAAEVAWAFEDTHRALSVALPECPAFSAGEPTEVVVFEDEDEFRRASTSPLASAYFVRVPDGLSPAHSQIAMMRARGQSITFAHEVTHRWVERCAPTMPVWMNEGLATVFETIRVREDDLVIGVPPFRFDDEGPEHGVRRDGSRVERVDPRTLPSIAELTSMTGHEWVVNEDPTARTASYAAAWALVHLLTIGGDAELRAAFAAYVADLRAFDADPDAVFARHLGSRDLDASLRAYVAGAQSQRRHVTYSAGYVMRPVGRPLEDGDVHLVRGTLLAQSQREGASAAARRELDAVVGPPRVDALLILADHARSAERAQLVDAAASLAPAGDSRITRARMFLAIERQDHDAIRTLLPALEGRTDLRARDLVLMARAYVTLHAYEQAVEAAQRVLEWEPASFRARYVLGWSLRALGRRDEAQPWLHAALALAPVVSPESRPVIQSALDEIVAHREANAALASLGASIDTTEALGPVVAHDAIPTGIGEHAAEITACYDHAIARGAGEGFAHVVGLIGPDGQIVRLEIFSTFHDAELDACLRGVFGAITFPISTPAGCPVVFAYPFVFSTAP